MTLHPVSDIAAMLDERIDAVVAELLPAAVRSAGYWHVGSTAGEAGKSLFVHRTGPKRGRWQDASTGEFGDALDLCAQVRCGGDKKEAIRWARGFLGLGAAASPADAGAMRAADGRRRAREDARRAEERRDAARRARGAQAMFLSAESDLRGTPVESYLAGRGVDLASLGAMPRSLRFHPGLKHGPTGRVLPAMVAAVCAPDGTQAAVHRTWLQQCGDGVWRKADFGGRGEAKMVYGDFAGGAIRLRPGRGVRGGKGRPLHRLDDAAAQLGDHERIVAVTEGIEDALTVGLAAPGLRVLAAVSLSNIAGLWLPAAIREVWIFADNDDKPGPVAQLDRAVHAHRVAGRGVRLFRATGGAKDFNDMLTRTMRGTG